MHHRKARIWCGFAWYDTTNNGGHLSAQHDGQPFGRALGVGLVSGLCWAGYVRRWTEPGHGTSFSFEDPLVLHRKGLVNPNPTTCNLFWDLTRREDILEAFENDKRVVFPSDTSGVFDSMFG